MPIHTTIKLHAVLLPIFFLHGYGQEVLGAQEATWVIVENPAIAWGPAEINALETKCREMEEQIRKMSPLEIKKWLTTDKHGRHDYQQLKMLAYSEKDLTKKEWDSIFGQSIRDGAMGFIGWTGHQALPGTALVEYIHPGTGKINNLEAMPGQQRPDLYSLSVRW
ncbi:MAG: hypothetical protein H0X38_16585 [Planctomycetes bacterium]|nr:hypothetical protein [Planctomycetota bacterium]